MNTDRKNFTGRLNSDIDERLFSLDKFRGDYSDAYNCLILSAIDSGIGLVKGFKGTTEVTTSYSTVAAKKVIGIEYVADAIKDAVINSEINGIDNTLFFAGDMKDVLTTEFIATHGKPQVVITDPPRAGMHEDVCKKLLFMRSEKIVYISCNPATQARDIAILDEAYDVAKIQPVDMFPHTEHVENIVLLTLKY